MSATDLITAFIDELGDDEAWQGPCDRCLLKFRTASFSSDLSDNEAAACVIYFVAVANHIGGPSESFPLNPLNIAEMFEIERTTMLTAYVQFLKAFEDEQEYGLPINDPYLFVDDEED